MAFQLDIDQAAELFRALALILEATPAHDAPDSRLAITGSRCLAAGSIQMPDTLLSLAQELAAGCWSITDAQARWATLLLGDKR